MLKLSIGGDVELRKSVSVRGCEGFMDFCDVRLHFLKVHIVEDKIMGPANQKTLLEFVVPRSLTLWPVTANTIHILKLLSLRSTLHSDD